MFKKFLFFICSIAVHFCINAYSLPEALQDAMQNDKQFQGENLTFEAAKQKLVQGKSALMPKVTFNQMHMKNTAGIRNVSDSMDGLQTYQSNVRSLNLTQPIYDRAAMIEADIGELNMQVGLLNLQKARLDLFNRVSQLFVEILNLESNINLIKFELNNINKVIDKLYCQDDSYACLKNFDDQLKLHESMLRVYQLESNLKNEERVLTNKYENLFRITGRKSFKKLNTGYYNDCVKGNLFDKVPEQKIKELVYEKNIDIEIQKINLLIADKTIKLFASSSYPVVSLMASHVQSNGIPLYPKAIMNAHSIGIQLSVPLFNGFASQSKTEEAKSQYKKVLVDIDLAKDNSMQVNQVAITNTLNAIQKLNSVELQINRRKLWNSIKNQIASDDENKDYDLLQVKILEHDKLVAENEAIVNWIMLYPIFMSIGINNQQPSCNIFRQ